MRATETVDAAVNLCRANWKPFAVVVAWVMVPLEFLQQLAVRGSYQPFPVPFDPSATRSPAPSGGAIAATAVLSLVTLLVIRPLLTAAMIRAISAAYLGEPIGVGPVYRFALGRFGAILWVLLLEILAITGLAVIPLLLGVILVRIHAAPLAVLEGVGAIALIVLVYVRWVLATAVVVVEDRRGTKALRRSWELTRSSFWRLAGALLLSGLLSSIVGGLIAALPTIVSLFVPAGWLLRATGGVLSSMVTTPFLTAVTVLLYFDGRIRREGLDITMMLREITASP